MDKSTINYNTMFTSYPDVVNIIQLKEMLGIGMTLAYRLVRNKTIQAKKIGRQYKIPKTQDKKIKNFFESVNLFYSNDFTLLFCQILSKFHPFFFAK